MALPRACAPDSENSTLTEKQGLLTGMSLSVDRKALPQPMRQLEVNTAL